MFDTLRAADGHDFACWRVPARGPRLGGLVLLQEVFGVTGQLRAVGARYAALGLDIAIPALFDRQRRDAVIPFDTPEAGRELMRAADVEGCMRDTAAAVQALAEGGGKVAVLGFCWGGGLAIRAAQTLDIACAVAFYGTRLPDYLDRPLRAPVMGHFATHDDHVPPEMLAAARAALPDMIVHLYEAGHGFANDARPNHRPDCAELAHARSEAFLRAHLAAP